MNFFKRQDEARRYTALLLAYLLAAVVLIVVAVNAVVYGSLVLGEAIPADPGHWLGRRWWILISAGTVVLILAGSLVRYLRLRGGGHAVAGFMGARRVRPDTRDAGERRYVNVVEEMSIASGTPVPDLYIMDAEPGINAFVAGYRPTEAVMVVSRGALDSLNRDELQGVVAHEFSHIFNGDMRLNVRLMAILAGILSLGIIGRLMMRSMRGARIGSSSGGRGGQGQAAVLFTGLALFVLGYIGLFFGRLIKAAVSRQREFLADASSVQYTRNPSGLAGALWKIQRHSNGSLLASKGAEETSHMCFAQSVTFNFQNLLATHPPLDERLRRVDRHYRAKMAADGSLQAAATSSGPKPDAQGVAMGFAGSATPVASADPQGVVQSVGNPGPEHVSYAARLQRAIPESLIDAVHESRAAARVVYALLLGEIDEQRINIALALIKYETKADDDESIVSIQQTLSQLDKRFRLPLIDLALPALRRIPAEERKIFIRVCDKIVRIDRRVSLFEFVLLALVKKQLRPDSNAGDRREYRSMDRVMPEIRILITLVSRAGSSDPAEIETSFTRAMRTFTQEKVSLVEEAYCGFELLDGVFNELAALSPLLKRSLLVACADCVMRDCKITVEEAEILRGVSELLDCPMPPLVYEDPAVRAA